MHWASWLGLARTWGAGARPARCQREPRRSPPGVPAVLTRRPCLPADTPIEEFTPTPAFPALQYLESVDEGGVAWQAGLRTGDFLIEVGTRASAPFCCGRAPALGRVGPVLWAARPAGRAGGARLVLSTCWMPLPVDVCVGPSWRPWLELFGVGRGTRTLVVGLEVEGKYGRRVAAGGLAAPHRTQGTGRGPGPHRTRGTGRGPGPHEAWSAGG